MKSKKDKSLPALVRFIARRVNTTSIRCKKEEQILCAPFADCINRTIKQMDSIYAN